MRPAPTAGWIAGTYIGTVSEDEEGKVLKDCLPCPDDEYQDALQHTEPECKKQLACDDAGTLCVPLSHTLSHPSTYAATTIGAIVAPWPVHLGRWG